MRTVLVCRLLFVGAWLLLSAVDAAAQAEIRLPAGKSRIAGRVVAADTGAPLQGVSVRLVGDALPADLARTAITDAGGAFDFPGIPARDYWLTASKAGFYTRSRIGATPMGKPVKVDEGRTVDGVTLTLSRGGAIAGRIVDQFGDPVERVRVFAQRAEFRQDGTSAPIGMPAVSDVTNDLGEFRVYALVPGEYLVFAAGRNAKESALGLLDPWSEAETAPTFYPGTANAAQAQPVSIGAGAEAFVQMTLLHTPLVTLSGTVVGADGRPAAGLQVSVSYTTGVSSTARGAGTVSPAGTFSIPNVAPGDYRIEVLSMAAMIKGGSERGRITVTVGSEDIDGLSIVTRPGATVSGTVVFERPYTGTIFQISASPVDPGMFAPGGTSEPIQADGRFELRASADRVYLAPTNSSWITKSILADGRELVDEPLDLGGRTSLSGVRVTVSDLVSEVAGTASDNRDRRLADQLVMLLRLDAPGLLPRDRVQLVRTDEAGEFVIHRVRPGSYVAGVIGDIENGEQYSPDLHESLRVRGHRVTVNAGEPVRLELKPIEP